ncbi:hypothetical protein DUNSADRAFT_9820 [Dunaliella salina]|uniref:Uncharacterized protein n=1 Tax=Dunaliella salina TaxID=3046 RepID=A0ABQ7GGM8_DUNSA|nr:hypothetical protein DUNSADRAFT_9820 [Dunaliella salina]|eukprot:KAF5833753.1 hypothetical protein DUNSADRAFT_9820 [Dunaliella salina]
MERAAELMVEWDVWWRAWPSRLIKVIQDRGMVDKLAARLSHPGNSKRFYIYVEKCKPQTISVREVEQAFPPWAQVC